MKEVWKYIEGYEKTYSVSNCGRVRRNCTVVRVRNHPLMKKKNIPERIIKLNYSQKYPSVCLSKNNIHKTFLVHILVAKSFIKNLSNKPQVNHKDLIETNNYVNNLEWVTRKENCEHAVRNGVYRRGEKHYLSKMTPELILEIRKEYIPFKVPSRYLAKKYKIAQSSMMSILKRKTWTHI